MIAGETCAVKGLAHVAIVVRDIEETAKFYRDTFGLKPEKIVDLPERKIRACFMPLGNSLLELIQPTDADTGLGRFLETRGEGLHHICLQVENIQQKLDILKQKGLALIDQQARPGLEGQVAFIHPKSTRGVLIELVET
jgi:methylmalonyl-CoA epimerase